MLVAPPVHKKRTQTKLYRSILTPEPVVNTVEEASTYCWNPSLDANSNNCPFFHCIEYLPLLFFRAEMPELAEVVDGQPEEVDEGVGLEVDEGVGEEASDESDDNDSIPDLEETEAGTLGDVAANPAAEGTTTLFY